MYASKACNNSQSSRIQHKLSTCLKLAFSHNGAGHNISLLFSLAASKTGWVFSCLLHEAGIDVGFVSGRRRSPAQ